MAGIITSGRGIKQAGVVLMILGVVIFGCHRCSRSVAPEIYEAAYPVCERDYSVTLNNSSETITIRNDCWSGKFSAPDKKKVSQRIVPEYQPYLILCSNGTILSMSAGNSGVCYYPVRYKAEKAEELKMVVWDTY